MQIPKDGEVRVIRAIGYAELKVSGFRGQFPRSSTAGTPFIKKIAFHKS